MKKYHMSGSHNIFRSIERVLTEGANHANTMYSLAHGTVNVLRGVSFVSFFSWLEEIDEPNWGALLDPSQTTRPFQWWGWDEFINLYKIRHCFGHTITGTLLSNLAQGITDFQSRLERKEIQFQHMQSQDMVTSPVYYTIENNRIILQDRAIQRCYSTVAQYVLENPQIPMNDPHDLPLDLSDD